MNPDPILQIIPQAGGFVAAAYIAWRVLVTDTTWKSLLESANERAKKLEEENSLLREELAALRGEVSALRDQVAAAATWKDREGSYITEVATLTVRLDNCQSENRKLLSRLARAERDK